MEYRIIRKENGGIVKRNRKNGIEYLTFPNIENTHIVSHLFTTRLGGVSEGYFASMNVSYTRGDRKEAVDENFRRIAQLLDRTTADFVLSDQTHTTNIRTVTERDRGKGILRERDYHDVDGLITNVPGIVLTAFYADCVPLYFVDPAHKAIGLSHAGWRGTVGGIGKRTIARMQEEFGSDPKEMIAAIGPSICQDCYEVGEDVAEQFVNSLSDEGSVKRALRYTGETEEGKKYRLNLWSVNYDLMLEAGMLPEHICITDICTCCNADYLFSHRASKGKRGNLGAFLSID